MLQKFVDTQLEATIECTTFSVHDTKALEDQGVASVFVASDVFVDAAESQARSLGFEATPIYTRHPIQDRTDEEMVEIADKAIDEIVAKLTGAA